MAEHLRGDGFPKRGFATQEQAQWAVDQINYRNPQNEEMAVYRCRVCRELHIGRTRMFEDTRAWRDGTETKGLVMKAYELVDYIMNEATTRSPASGMNAPVRVIFKEPGELKVFSDNVTIIYNAETKTYDIEGR